MPVRVAGVVLALTSLFACSDADQPERFITVAATTSTQNSGLFDHILPRFEARTGIEVRVVAAGTGQAIRLAERGDADVLFVHHRPSEERFVAAGYGVRRFDVMYNDFVILGPAADPAGVRGAPDAPGALARIAQARAAFVSRGDDSGTHKKERSLWKSVGLAPAGAWYREVGSGMGATINIAAGMNAYTLSDRSTWLAFSNKRELAIVHEGDPRLHNQYGVIAVHPERHGHVKVEAARAFVQWLTSTAGQEAIASFRIDGRQVFFSNAKGGP